MPKQIQEGEVAQALTRRYGLVGKLPLLLDEVIVPVAIVDTLELNRERNASGAASRPAVAAQFSHVQLFNPADSGVLVQATRVWIGTGSAVTGLVQFHDTALTTAGADVEWVDRRQGGAPVAQVRSEANAVAQGSANIFKRLYSPATDSKEVALRVALLPGMGVLVQLATLNVTLQAAYDWTERNLLPGE